VMFSMTRSGAPRADFETLPGGRVGVGVVGTEGTAATATEARDSRAEARRSVSPARAIVRRASQYLGFIVRPPKGRKRR
jgi:hypothetical protein